MTPTASPRDASELAVLVPYQLGYHPGPSLVLAALHGRRLGMVQRLDLVDDPRACAALAEHSIAIMVRERAQGVVVLAFEDDEGGSRPFRAAVTSAALAAGLAVPDHVVVRDGRCWVPGCDDGCCPPQVRALPRPEEVPAVAPFVMAGVRPLSSREELVATVVPPTDETRAEGVAQVIVSGEPVPVDDDELAALWSHVLDPRPSARPVGDLPDAELAVLGGSLLDVQWRDALMAVLAPGFFSLDDVPLEVGWLALDAAAECPWVDCWEGDDELPQAGEWSDELLLVRGRLVELARLLPQPLTPTVLVTVAHLAWWAGDGTITGICLERALEIDPEHRLADLMLRLLATGVRPWALPPAEGPQPGRDSIGRAS